MTTRWQHTQAGLRRIPAPPDRGAAAGELSAFVAAISLASKYRDRVGQMVEFWTALTVLGLGSTVLSAFHLVLTS